MPDTVLQALKNKLARYEADGEADRVTRVKARIAELEKAPAGKAPALAMTLSQTVVTSTPAPIPTVKKASTPKKLGARKKK